MKNFLFDKCMYDWLIQLVHFFFVITIIIIIIILHSYSIW